MNARSNSPNGLSEPLYGLTPLTGLLVPRMVLGNDHPEAPRGKPVPGPVVQLLGGRLSGKSAVLRDLEAQYTGRTPTASVDLAHPGFGQPGLADVRAHVGSTGSLVTHLLFLLAARLGADVPGMHRIEFPRLSLGLLMATAWRPLRSDASGEDEEGGEGDEGEEGVLPADYRRELERLGTWLEQMQPNASRRERRRRFAALFDVLVTHLGAVTGLPEPISGLVVDTARPLLESTGLDEAPFSWWGARMRRRGVHHSSNLWLLIAFHAQFRGEDTRIDAEEDLVAAFLDDIDAYYTRKRLGNGAKRPLILLDNVHAEPGRALLRLLLPHYDLVTTRPVVVATQLDDGREPRPGPLALLGQGWPDGGAVRLALPPLSQKNIRAMLTGRGLPASLQWPVARFSAGRAGCVRHLVDAARGEHGLSPAPGTAGDAGSYADELLLRLLPEADTREDLTLLAPALDSRAAHRLWRARTPPRVRTPLEAEARFVALSRELAAAHWHRRPWPWPSGELVEGRAPFVADQGLRTLLLHRLTASASEEAAGRWTRTHLFLRSLYNLRELPPGAAEHSVPYLHHTLALHDLASVVRCLHHRLTRSGPEEWLAAVNAICAAPRPPAGVVPVTDDGLGCPSCETVHHQEAHDMVRRLVTYVWRHSGPLAPVPTTDELPDTFHHVSVQLHSHNRERGVIEALARVWYGALRRGVQAPHLPPPRGVEP